MRKQLIVLLFLAFIADTSLAQNDAREIVYGLHLRKFNWLIEQRLDSLTNLLDDEVLYIHSNGWSQSKSDVINDFKAGKLKYTEIKVQEATVRMYDQTAIVVGKGQFKGALNGIDFWMNLVYTEVYARQKGKWKLVSRQSCKL